MPPPSPSPAPNPAAWPDANQHCLFLSNGVFDPDEPANLVPIFAAYTQAFDAAKAANLPAPPLVVHFHGGLVAKQVGLESAQLLAQTSYTPAGAFPVFFVWESGFVESLKQALPHIFGEAIFKLLLERVGQFAVGKIDQFSGANTGGTRGSGTLVPASRFYVLRELNKGSEPATPVLNEAAPASAVPFSDKDPGAVPEGETLHPSEETLFTNALLADPALHAESAKIAQGLRPEEDVQADIDANEGARGGATAPIRASDYTLMSPDVLQEMRPPQQTVDTDEATRGLFSAAAALARLTQGAARILKNVVTRFAGRRDHGVQATIVEEILREFYLANIGTAVWDAMKTNAQNAWQTGETFGGTAFLNQLNALVQTGHAPPRVVLVGHSTGAIYICALLEASARVLPADVRFDIVFLAPAVDFKRLAKTLHDHHERVSNFRVFGMHDEVERIDFLLDLPQLNSVPFLKGLYPGSLLYFVSGVLEGDADKPLVGMERYYRDGGPYGAEAFPEIADVKAFMTGPPDRRVWSKTDATAALGLQTESIHHGDFDNDPTTLRSLARILQTGY